MYLCVQHLSDATSDKSPPATANVSEAEADALHYWYPKLINDTIPACVYDDRYPDDYMTNEVYREAFIFDARVDCCEAYPIACDDVVLESAVTTTVAPGGAVGSTEVSGESV